MLGATYKLGWISAAVILGGVLLASGDAGARGAAMPAGARRALVERIQLDLNHGGKLQLRRSRVSNGLESSGWIREGDGSRAGKAFVYNAKAVSPSPWGKNAGTYIVVEQQDYQTQQVRWEAFPVALQGKSDGGISKARMKTINRGPQGNRTIDASLYADGLLGPTKVVGGFHAVNTGEGYGYDGSELVAQKIDRARKQMTFYVLGSPDLTSDGATAKAALYGGPVPMFTRGPGAAANVAPPPGTDLRPPRHPDWNASLLNAKVGQLFHALSASAR
jgi:hypothetical protein